MPDPAEREVDRGQMRRPLAHSVLPCGLPHIHCVVPGGGLAPDGSRWVSCRKRFFIPVKVMSSLFSGKFLDYLKDSFESADLIFPGGISHLKNPRTFEVFRGQFHQKKW